MSTPLAAEIRRGMTYHKITVTDLAAKIGVTVAQLSSYRFGHTVPRHELVIKIADTLPWGRLVKVSLSVRRKSCALCGAVFHDDSQRMNKEYCSVRCRRTTHARVVRGDVQERYVITQRRLDRHVASVDAMCRACVPDGLCRDSACPLRPVSPFACITRATV